MSHPTPMQEYRSQVFCFQRLQSSSFAEEWGSSCKRPALNDVASYGLAGDGLSPWVSSNLTAALVATARRCSGSDRVRRQLVWLRFWI